VLPIHHQNVEIDDEAVYGRSGAPAFSRLMRLAQG
jgi:hypothetical protein